MKNPKSEVHFLTRRLVTREHKEHRECRGIAPLCDLCVPSQEVLATCVFTLGLLMAAVPGIRASDASLVAWYPFEGDAHDSSSYQNDGVNSSVVFEPGRNGLCAAFNGASSSVRIPQTPSVKLTGPMTLSAWIKPLATDGLRCIVDKDAGYVGYNLYVDGGRLHMRICGSALSAGTITNGGWQHVAGVYTGDRICLYVNGQPSGETPAGALVDRDDKDVFIGVWGPPGGPARYFAGWMDDVRIYARALTPEEILDEILGPPNYALDWWTVDGGGTDTLSVGQFTLSGTIGQPDAGTMTGGNYTLSGGFWGVIAAVQTPGAPWLSVMRSNNAVVVFWPWPAEGWVLEWTNALPPAPAPWPRVAPPYQTNGANLQVSEPLPVGNRFYRLHKP